MPLPEPVPGLVIRYSYLWRDEFFQGREEGQKDRPCAIILATEYADGETLVTVLPITHTPPAMPGSAIEIPPDTKRRLNLDDESSWIVLTEANRFRWPGPDLRPPPSGDFAYGLLPYSLYEKVRGSFIALLKAHRGKVTARSE